MRSFNKFLIPTVVGASLVLAACGSSSHNTSSHPSTASAYGSQPASSSSSTLKIGTASDSAGTYLTGASGRALYLFLADAKDKSNCAGACAKAWPPLTAGSMPKVTGGANAAELSLISRPGGAKQVAYKGRPLYYYAGDTGPGMTNGQGLNAFGAKWWLISPSGSQVGGSSGSSNSSNGGYGGSSGGGYG